MTKKLIKTTLKAVLGVCLGLVAVLLILLIWSYGLGFFYDSNNIKYQDEHLEYLKSEYYTDTYVPCDEQKMADFDIERAEEYIRKRRDEGLKGFGMMHVIIASYIMI